MPSTKLIIVDDDNFSRTTLSGGLSALGYQVIAAVPAANQAIAAIANDDPEIAILDLDLGPGPTGLDLALLLRKRNPNIGIIFLTSYSDPRFLISPNDQLPIGSRYLVKSQLSNLGILVNMINQTRALPLKTSYKSPKVNSKLSTKQLTTLKLLAEGKTTSQIAEKLGVSIKAVEGIISRLNNNLGLMGGPLENRRVQLVKAYYRLIGKI
jgi:DNA-binding NarL/FixJ family response regulator